MEYNKEFQYYQDFRQGMEDVILRQERENEDKKSRSKNRYKIINHQNNYWIAIPVCNCPDDYCIQYRILEKNILFGIKKGDIISADEISSYNELNDSQPYYDPYQRFEQIQTITYLEGIIKKIF